MRTFSIELQISPLSSASPKHNQAKLIILNQEEVKYLTLFKQTFITHSTNKQAHVRHLFKISNTIYIVGPYEWSGRPGGTGCLVTAL